MKRKPSTFAEIFSRFFSSLSGFLINKFFPFFSKFRRKGFKLLLKISALILAMGAMGTVGFLSFSGASVLGVPVGLALFFMCLAISYEFEINFQNIRNAFKKVFLSNNHIENTLAQQYLIKNFPINDPSRPQFFNDYLQLVNDLNNFSDSSLTKKEIKKRTKELKENVKIFEEIFAQSLFGLPIKRDEKGQWKNYVSKYQDELLKWLETHNEYKWQPESVKKPSHSFNPYDALQSVIKWFKKKPIKTCGLLEATEEPTHFNKVNAFLGGKDGLLRFEKKLFFVDQAKKTVSEIAITHANEARYKYLLANCTENYKRANPQQLSFIASLTNHVVTKNKNKIKNYTQKQMKTLLVKRVIEDRLAQLFSILSGSAMGFATLYLLSGALSALSLTLPGGVIIALATASGLAYVWTIYNTVSDMISDQTIQKWFKRAVEQFRQGRILLPFLTILLFSLGLLVTIFTAGTWWTVIKTAPSIYRWMGKLCIPAIVSIITVLGSSALAFNLQNISETLSIVMAKIVNKNFFSAQTFTKIKDWAENHFSKEHPIQIINPFRWYLSIVIPTIEILFFTVHLACIGAMSDELRFKRLSEKFQKLFSFFQIGAGTALEAGSDGHYFLGDDHEGKEQWSIERQILHTRTHAHGHNHHDDFPSRLIKFVASGFFSIYLAAAIVDVLGSWCHKDPKCHLSFKEAWGRQRGHHTHAQKPDYPVQPLSAEAEAEIVKTKIDKFENKHLTPIRIGKEIKEEKKTALHQTKKALNQMGWSGNNTSAGEVLQQNMKLNAGVYAQCRLFTPSKTKSFMDKLVNRFVPPAA